MFAFLFLFLFVLFGFGIYYLSRRIRKYEKIQQLKTKGVILSWLIPVLFSAIITLVFGFFNAIIILLHIFVAIGLCGLAGFFIKRFFNKIPNHKFIDASAIALTVVYLGIGWFFGHHIFQTNYTFDTQKDIGQEKIRVVQITDSHLGVTVDGERFGEQIEKIQGLNPDIVVITGDFVDDDSSKEDMVKACKALGNLKTTFGVYFVYGNHDEGYFNSRNFSAEELKTQLENNGVNILEDETVLINENFYLIGRKDRSYPERKDMETLVADLDKSKYMLVLDHQPNDYEAQRVSKVDLVLSGHTHGGHIFPAGIIGVLMGANDLAYGTETRDNTNFVVSSGLSGWAIPFKTGAISEYVVIDIK